MPNKWAGWGPNSWARTTKVSIINKSGVLIKVESDKNVLI